MESASTNLSIKKIVVLVLCLLFVSSFAFAEDIIREVECNTMDDVMDLLDASSGEKCVSSDKIKKSLIESCKNENSEFAINNCLMLLAFSFGDANMCKYHTTEKSVDYCYSSCAGTLGMPQLCDNIKDKEAYPSLEERIEWCKSMAYPQVYFRTKDDSARKACRKLKTGYRESCEEQMRFVDEPERLEILFQGWGGSGEIANAEPVKSEFIGKDGKKRELRKYFYKSGRLMKELSYYKGKIDGIKRDFYENGKLYYESYYKNGKLEGIAKEYYESGKLKSETPYFNGKENGKRIIYHESGPLASEISYKDGRIHGDYKTYYANRNLASEVYYHLGKKRGLHKTYHKNGQLESQVAYDENGKEHGMSEAYYPSGKLKGTLEFIHGKPEGASERYYENGQLKEEEFYKNGKLISPTKRYYQNGQLRASYVMDGIEKQYYEDGTLKSETPIKNGLKYGISKSYYSNGKLKQETHFGKGKILEKKSYPSNRPRLIKKTPHKKDSTGRIIETEKPYKKESYSNKPYILHRTVRNCSDHSPIGEPEVKKLRRLDGALIYRRFKCRSRYQEQCIKDGSFDKYYDEWCEDKDGKRIEVE